MSQTQNLGVVSVLGKGMWGSGQTYPKLSIVRSGNASYLAYIANSNIQPGVTSGWESYWMLLAEDPTLTQSDISEIISELLSQIQTTDAYQKGYSEGETAGFSSGQEAEYNSFWDSYQNNGNRTNYQYAFSYNGWTNECYNPKYDIVCSGTGGRAIFVYNQIITDTKVKITFDTTADQAFNWCTSLQKTTIEVNENTKFSNTFYNCTSLADLTVDGVIGQNGFDVSACPLTVASLKSISLALADYHESEPGTYIITIGSNNYNTLTFSPEGNGIIQTMEGRGWTIQ